MRESNIISSVQSALWKRAGNVTERYRQATRNPDPKIRASFKRDSNVVGTGAWGLCQCMRFSTTNFTDAECAEIATAIGL